MGDFTVTSASSASSASTIKKTVYREINGEYTHSRHSPLMEMMHLMHLMHFFNAAKVTP